VIDTLVSDAIALPISFLQLESLKSFTVSPLITPLTLIVGVKLRPDELSGSTKDNDDGAVTVTFSSSEPPLPLQEERRIKAQINEGNFQPQERRATR
jgi:hypothetical protein